MKGGSVAKVLKKSRNSHNLFKNYEVVWKKWTLF